MNLLRRFLVLIYGLALLALVTVSLLFPESVANALLALGTTSTTARAIVVTVVDLAIIMALFLLIRAPQREELDGLIVKTPGARADINITSARELILKAVRDVPNVVSAEVKLTAPAGKADIDLAVEVTGANINVPNKQREIDRALRQVALKQLGLQLANQPRVHIQLVTEEELRAREEAARPLPPPAAPPVTPAPEAWTPAPVTQTAPPIETIAPVIVPLVVEPAAPPVSEEPAVTGFAWEPSPEPEEPAASDFVLESAAPPAAPEASWYESEPGDGLLTEPDFVGESTYEEEPAAPEASWDESEPGDGLLTEPEFVAESTNEEEPAAPVVEAATEETDDEALSVPPLDFVTSLEEAPEPSYEIDASVLNDIDPDAEDWLTPNSSPDDQTGLYAEDDERSRREAGEQSPPLPDLD